MPRARKLSGVGGNVKETTKKKVKRISDSGKIQKIPKPQIPVKNNLIDKLQTSSINGSLVNPRTGRIYVGFHASSSGGVHNAINHSVSVEASAFALFLRPQRTWTAPKLTTDVVEKFHSLREENDIPIHLILPHGSYLINLGSPDIDQRDKSQVMLVDELQRCEELGLRLFNIHPGSSTGKISRDECIRNIAYGINQAHDKTKGSKVMVVLENMSCQGHTIGGDFKELKQIIDFVDDKSRVGVCLDTCHAMAAGYDLSQKEGFDRMVENFETEIGWQWLVGMHINDSKGPAGCHRDRHANIGEGTIGLDGFRRIMNCSHFTDIPLILETPIDENIGIEKYRKEIKLLLDMVETKRY